MLAQAPLEPASNSVGYRVARRDVRTAINCVAKSLHGHCGTDTSPSRSTSSRRFNEENAAERLRLFAPRHNQCVEPETTTKAVDGENQLDHQKEEIAPRPLPLGIVEAEPQVEYLKCANQTPEAHEDPQDQRYRSQGFEGVDDRGEQVEVRQYDIVYEIGLQWDGGGLPHHPHPISETSLDERLVGVIGVEGRQLPQCLLPPHAA